jgi:hypothetical protein
VAGVNHVVLVGNSYGGMVILASPRRWKINIVIFNG